jgi:hypothetical protein
MPVEALAAQREKRLPGRERARIGHHAEMRWRLFDIVYLRAGRFDRLVEGQLHARASRAVSASRATSVSSNGSVSAPMI